ncbi:hypothetical protein [Streptomyces sp. NPDC005012]|uniref:hypothetical protein n=1 Tax=unclassified Streptomyces TaxID=2593676 RepID=UPI0033A735E0
MSRTRRTNLPPRVTPGQQYRDVTVAYRLASRLTGEPEDSEHTPDEDAQRHTPDPATPDRSGPPAPQ